MVYSFAQSKIDSKFTFIDGVGYRRVSDLLSMRASEYIELYRRFQSYRYNPNNWKNNGNSLSNALNLFSIKNSIVLDIGSGFGLEALALAKNGNKVIISDIIDGGLQLADKTLKIFGYKPYRKIHIHGTPPYFKELDVEIHNLFAIQSLNYNEDASSLMTELKSFFKPNGRAYIMGPSESGWTKATSGASIPGDAVDITGEPGYAQFKQFFAPQVQYINLYNQGRVTNAFVTVSNYTLLSHTEVSADNRYGVSVLKP